MSGIKRNNFLGLQRIDTEVDLDYGNISLFAPACIYKKEKKSVHFETKPKTDSSFKSFSKTKKSKPAAEATPIRAVSSTVNNKVTANSSFLRQKLKPKEENKVTTKIFLKTEEEKEISQSRILQDFESAILRETEDSLRRQMLKSTAKSEKKRQKISLIKSVMDTLTSSNNIEDQRKEIKLLDTILKKNEKNEQKNRQHVDTHEYCNKMLSFVEHPTSSFRKSFCSQEYLKKKIKSEPKKIDKSRNSEFSYELLAKETLEKNKKEKIREEARKVIKSQQIILNLQKLQAPQAFRVKKNKRKQKETSEKSTVINEAEFKEALAKFKNDGAEVLHIGITNEEQRQTIKTIDSSLFNHHESKQSEVIFNNMSDVENGSPRQLRILTESTKKFESALDLAARDIQMFFRKFLVMIKTIKEVTIEESMSTKKLGGNTSEARRGNRFIFN